MIDGCLPAGTLAFYKQGFIPDPGYETLNFNSGLAFVPNDIDGTGLRTRGVLALGPRGVLESKTYEEAGLWGLIVGGMYTQPLSTANNAPPIGIYP